MGGRAPLDYPMWMRLHIAAVSCVFAVLGSGCFVLFHDPDGGGGAGSTTSSASGSSTGSSTGSPSSVSASSGPDCSSIDLKSSPMNCGACGHACESGSCIQGTCQGLVVGTLPTSVPIAALVANTDYVFALKGNFIYRFAASAIPDKADKLIPSESGNVQDGAGSLAAGAGGTAYYAPQGTPSIDACEGAPFNCQVVSVAVGNPTHYNGLHFDGTNLFMILPDMTSAGSIWRADTTIGLTSWTREISDGTVSGHKIASNPKSGFLAWSHYDTAPCVSKIAIGKTKDDVDDFTACGHAYTGFSVVNMAMGGDGNAYAIVKDSLGIRRVEADGNFFFFPMLKNPVESAIGTDDDHVYLSNDSMNDPHGLVRCDNGDVTGVTCVGMDSVAPQSLAVTDLYVWYTDGLTIYRATR